jgi:tetratricopeptide (TPR) repeat protein
MRIAMVQFKSGTHISRAILRSILSLFLCGILLPAVAQNPFELDSLLTSLKFAGTEKQKASLLLDLSDYYLSTDFSVALDYGMQSLEISEALDDDLLVATSNLKLSNIYTLSGAYDDALRHALTSLEILEQRPASDELFRNYVIIGVLHDRIFKYDEALNYYFEALNVSNKLKAEMKPSVELPNEIILYNNIGNIYETRNDDNRAIEYYMMGVELGEKNSDYVNLGILYNNLGKINDKLKHYDEALEYLNKSLEVREQINDLAGMAKSYYFICSHYLELKAYDIALEYGLKSYELGREVGSLQTQHTAVSMLYEIYYILGKYREAADYHVIFKDISDSLYNYQSLNEISRLKMQYTQDREEAERQLALQNTKFKYALIIAILIIALILSLFFVVMARFKSRKISLENYNLELDVELKNKELTTNVIYLVRKNEMINGVAKKLLELKEQVSDQNKRPIQEIVLELQSEADKNVWKEFELRFQQVHKEFYNNLLKKHPDLTPVESRLVALLRLNMSSKEIATITHQNIKSVEVARARLRKKLGLTGTDKNLITYLHSL